MTHLSITILRPLRTRLTVQLRRSNRRSPHLGCHNDRPPGDRRRVRGRCRSTPLSAWTRSFRPGPPQHEEEPRRQDRFPHVTTAPSATHVCEAVGKLRHISVPAVHHRHPGALPHTVCRDIRPSPEQRCGWAWLSISRRHAKPTAARARSGPPAHRWANYRGLLPLCGRFRATALVLTAGISGRFET